jgi:RNA polymerase sigma-70 factor (ECF subfamily)
MLDLLDRLPMAQAEVLGLRVVLGLSLQEVAEVTGSRLIVVQNRLLLAKSSLRERMLASTRYADALGEQL